MVLIHVELEMAFVATIWTHQTLQPLRNEASCEKTTFNNQLHSSLVSPVISRLLEHTSHANEQSKNPVLHPQFGPNSAKVAVWPLQLKFEVYMILSSPTNGWWKSEYFIIFSTSLCEHCGFVCFFQDLLKRPKCEGPPMSNVLFQTISRYHYHELQISDV